MSQVLTASADDIDTYTRMMPYAPTANFRAIKQVQHGVITAFIGYDCWTFNAVQMHYWVLPGYGLTRNFLREAFRYPFVYLKLQIALGITPCDNQRALEVNRRIGFLEITRIKDGWLPGTDLVIQELRREHCKWLRGVPS